MYHHVAHAVGDSLLFRTWREGLWLWRCILHEVPSPIAVAIMPDHVHVLHTYEVHRQLAHAMGSYVHHRNSARGTDEPGVTTVPRGNRVVGGQKQRRDHRYVYLNPVRANLVDGPLSWPLSTYRDCLGLAAWPVIPPTREPERFHARVSADPSVDADGRRFPTRTFRTDDLVAVLHATSAVTRTPVAALRRRGRARTLFLQAAAALCPRVRRTEVAALVGADRSTAIRASRLSADSDPAVKAVAHAVGDPRFPPLHDGVLPFAR